MHFALIYPLIHQILAPVFPGCLWQGCSTSKTIALTFDDGPHPHHTPLLLDVLDRYGIPASFFWLGVCVRRRPELARAIYERGHWIGLHGYDHQSFPMLSADQLHYQLQQTQEAIAHACLLDPLEIHHRLRDVRPPNGLFTPQTLAYLRQWGYRTVMWSVVPEDWVRPGIAVAVNRILKQTCHGSLIVLHDGACGGEDVAAIAAHIIPHLLKQGYQFVTIEQLWQQQKELRNVD